MDELGFAGVAIGVYRDITHLVATPSVLRNLSPEQINWLNSIIVAGNYIQQIIYILTIFIDLGYFFIKLSVGTPPQPLELVSPLPATPAPSTSSSSLAQLSSIKLQDSSGIHVRN